MQRLPLGDVLGAGAGTGVERDVGGDVAGPVGYGAHLAALAEAGEGAEGRAGVTGVRVVGGGGEAGAQGADRAGPGRVTRAADLGAQPGVAARQGPPPGEPRGVRAGDRVAEPFGAVRAYQDVPGHTVPVGLGDVDRDVVEPLVGEEQTGQGTGRGQLGEPGDAVVQPGGPGGALDGVGAHAGAHRLWERRQYSGQQLATPGTHIDQRQFRRTAQGHVDAAQQGGERLGVPG